MKNVQRSQHYERFMVRKGKYKMGMRVFIVKGETI